MQLEERCPSLAVRLAFVEYGVKFVAVAQTESKRRCRALHACPLFSLVGVARC